MAERDLRNAEVPAGTSPPTKSDDVALHPCDIAARQAEEWCGPWKRTTHLTIHGSLAAFRRSPDSVRTLGGYASGLRWHACEFPAPTADKLKRRLRGSRQTPGADDWLVVDLMRLPDAFWEHLDELRGHA